MREGGKAMRECRYGGGDRLLDGRRPPGLLASRAAAAPPTRSRNADSVADVTGEAAPGRGIRPAPARGTLPDGTSPAP